MALLKQRALGECWRLGRETYSYGSVEWGLECFCCGMMGFGYGRLRKAMDTLGEHLVKEHPVECGCEMVQ